MATAFHLFPFLPRELRDEIWAFAIRPHRRGVQIFRVHNSAAEADIGPQRASRVLDEVNNSWHFGAPLESRYYKSLDGSPNKNVSAYMIDSGLWTACKESRRVIRKHFAEHSNNPWGPSGRALVSYCSGSNPFYISIWPDSDLITLQPDNFFPTSWSRIKTLACTSSPSVYPLEFCRDIGIDYDPAWADTNWVYDFSPGVDDMTSYVAVLFRSFPRRRLWLVDTNLKRKPGASSSHDSQTVQFYANDRKLVQVSLDKGEGNLREWEYIHPVAGGDYRDSSIYFAISANELGRFYDACPWFINDHRHLLGDRIGLLGWEDLKKS
ncbi:hypothetical protein DER44DRAFT_675173 [Fusarium oxysporum]|nr:hypothetical protein DER44DRAFT_675173 [Fusarium oxysporum]